MKNIIIPTILIFTLFYCAKNHDTAALEKAKTDSIMKRDTAALQEIFTYFMRGFAVDWSIRWNDTIKVFIGVQGWGDSTKPIKEGNYKLVTYTEGTEYNGPPLSKHYDYLCDHCSVNFYPCVIDSSTTTTIESNKADERLKNIWKWKYIGQRIILYVPSTFYPDSFFDHTICPIYHPKRCITLTVMEIQPL